MGRASMAAFSSGESFALQAPGDGLGDLALDGEHVGQVAVVVFGPLVGIGARVDQLRGDAHLVARALHAAFEQVRDTQREPISRTLRVCPRPCTA